MAKTRTLVVELDGVRHTKKTSCDYHYFWICDAILPSAVIKKDVACGWSYKPVNKDGQHPSWSATWFFTNTRCVPIASDQGEATVEKEEAEMPRQNKTKESIAVIERVLPCDIDKLCPVIGEAAYVDFYGDGRARFMMLTAITPRFLSFVDFDKRGWVEIKVHRTRKSDYGQWLCWRSGLGVLRCEFVWKKK